VPTQSIEWTNLSIGKITDLSGNPDLSEESKENYLWGGEIGKKTCVRELRFAFLRTGVKVFL